MIRKLLVLVAVCLLVGISTANVNDYNTSLVLLMHMNQTAGAPTTFIESSTGKTVTTVGGSTTTTVIKVLGNASGYFDGSGDYLTLADSASWDLGTNWTISSWVNFTALPSSGSISPVVGQMDNDGDHWEVRIGNVGGVYRWTIRRYRSGGSPIDKSITSNPVTPGTNTQHQIVFQKNATGYTFYQDGINVGSSLDSTAFETISSKLEVAAYIGSAPSYYKGYIDELAIWNGAVVPISDLYPQTQEIGNYTPEVEPPIASFTCTPTSATLGTSIACTDTSSDTPTNWTYYWGDGNVTDGTQNPSYTYPFTGTFSINQTVNNTLGSSWYNRSNYITITNVTSFTQQDIYLTGQYTITFNVKSSTTNLPIANVTVVDSVSGQSYPSTNGTAFLTLPAGLYYINFIADGYQSKQVTYVVDMDETHEVKMVPSAPTPSRSISNWYSPHQVRFAVVDSMGVKVVGATINASAIATTLPTDGTADWLTAMYGIDPDAANDMMNGTLIMHGITQSDGATVFTMLSSIGYSLAVTNPSNGVTQNVNVTPIDTIYTIHLLGTAANNTYMDMGYNTSLYITEPDVHNVTMNLAYQDMSARTTLLEFFVLARSNNTVINYQSTSSIGSNVILMNYTVPNVRPDRYSWYYNAVRVK